MGYGITVMISGPRACFTRPEMKSERMSYDVITPSAARGIIEAVYWKPAIRWVIDSIEVRNPIQFDTFRRNEVKSKLPYTEARRLAQGKSTKPLCLVASEDRAQRAMTYLRDVCYVVKAHFELTNRAGESDTPEKHYCIIRRRLLNGQHFMQPALGCREFPAKVELVESGDVQSTPGFYSDVDEKDLGFMLHDLDYSDPDHPSPRFFRAVMRRGVIAVPDLYGSGVLS